MFYRIYTVKLGTQANAKLAAAFFVEKFEHFVDMSKLAEVEVLLDAEGSVIVRVGCATLADMKKFIRSGDALMDELRQSFVCKSEKFSTISVFRHAQLDHAAE